MFEMRDVRCALRKVLNTTSNGHQTTNHWKRKQICFFHGPSVAACCLHPQWTMDESNIEKRTRMGRLMSPPPSPKKNKRKCIQPLPFWHKVSEIVAGKEGIALKVNQLWTHVNTVLMHNMDALKCHCSQSDHSHSCELTCCTSRGFDDLCLEGVDQ